METWMIVVVSLLVLLAAGLVLTAVLTKRRTATLKDRFGPEYDRTVELAGSRRQAEADLLSRAKRVERFELRPLTAAEADAFVARWREAQALFVDSPAAAVVAAGALVKDVMRARGFPAGDFEQRVADISVDHPHLVERYRAAQETALASRLGGTRTEEVRQAMVSFGTLVDELLETGEPAVVARYSAG
ncbi:MAG TPA: hypothetical protein VJS92_05965 [Candidatus Polarisedimenticolaceae bacterium]|nr:hypothetical protein [Candidatus Polarisedimenticolaceae bacterium]